MCGLDLRNIGQADPTLPRADTWWGFVCTFNVITQLRPPFLAFRSRSPFPVFSHSSLSHSPFTFVSFPLSSPHIFSLLSYLTRPLISTSFPLRPDPARFLFASFLSVPLISLSHHFL